MEVKTSRVVSTRRHESCRWKQNKRFGRAVEAVDLARTDAEKRGEGEGEEDEEVERR